MWQYLKKLMSLWFGSMIYIHATLFINLATIPDNTVHEKHHLTSDNAYRVIFMHLLMVCVTIIINNEH